MTLRMIPVFLFALAGCALNAQRAPVASPTAQEQTEFENAQRSLDAGKFQDSFLLFKEFQNHHPQSLLFQGARLGEARSLEGTGKWDESIAVLNDVYQKTVQYQPEIAAQAMYSMSFAYEAIGDDLKTVTTLLDTKKLGKYLPPEVTYAEIPARLAMVYGKFGRTPEAQSYLMDAERGLEKVSELKQKSLDKSWLAKTYFQMGSLSTNQLSAENFEQVALGLKQVQVYLLRAIEVNDPQWSPRALNHTKETYRDLLTTMKSVDSTDPSRRDQQNMMGGALVDLLNQADLYKPIDLKKMNSLQKDLYGYLSEVRSQTEKTLYSPRETMTLTEESQKLNSIKRVLPRKEKSPIPLPPKIVPSEDPNL